MDSPRARSRPIRAGRRTDRVLVAVGFLTFAVGFLTFSAVARPLDDALDRLGRLEAARGRILTQGDSLGLLLAGLPDGSGPAAARLLEGAERLAEESRELDLEILLERQRCRSLALQELESLRGTDSEEGVAEVSRLLDLLDRRLDDEWGTEFVFVKPDSTDGYETLLDKQAYLSDLRDRISALGQRLDRRVEVARREAELQRASRQFADESDFLDEGGRVGSDETVFLRGVPSGDPSGEGQARFRPSGAGREALEDLGSVGGLFDLEEGDRIPVLREAHTRLERDLDRVVAALRATEELLGRYEGRPQ